jgi:hypothetical protein
MIIVLRVQQHGLSSLYIIFVVDALIAQVTGSDPKKGVWDLESFLNIAWLKLAMKFES